MRQVLLFGIAYYGYRIVRGRGRPRRRGDRVPASRDIIGIEQSLGIFVEPSIQAWTHGSPRCRTSRRGCTSNAQFTVTMAALVYIYLRHNQLLLRAQHVRGRHVDREPLNYMLFPPAPPRFFPSGVPGDSVAQLTDVGHDSVTVNSLVNQYAVIPSMHVAFALMIAIPLARLCQAPRDARDWTRVSPGVAFVIISTANHFIADAFLGACTAASAPGPPPRWPAPPPPGGSRRSRRRLMAEPQTTPRPQRRDRARAPIGSGARREQMKDRLIESRLTPNAISITGLVLNVVAAVLVWQELYIVGGIAFIVGSVCDTLDGRYSRMSGKGTQFGAFLDSTLDRIEEGIVLTAVAAVFATKGDEVAAARRSWRCSRR